MRKLFILLCIIAAAPAVQSQCTDLFISEYLEGSSNNKAIEIYNPTSSTVNLANYKLYRANNGSPIYQDSLAMVGTLAPGAVFVAGNPTGDPAILAVSDTLHTITFFNGDDVIMLKNIGTNTELDIVGILGVDPGVNWVVGSGATSEFTLVRMSSVNAGTMNWTIGATQYDVHPQNTFSFLGSHTMTPCGPPPAGPQVSFSAASSSFNETAGTGSVTVEINQASTTQPTSVTFNLGTGSTATGGGVDYNFTTLPVNITWPANDSTPQLINFTIVDDVIFEGNETIVLELSGLSANASFVDSVHTVTIIDNETPVIPTYTIGTINTTDGSGVADSLGVECWTSGTVYGVDMRATGLQFTIRDNTGGIGVFNGANTFGYTVNEGDSISLKGVVAQFNGLTQITVDTIIVIGSGTLETPDVITALGENTESDLVQFNCASLVDPTQWTNLGSGFNVDITDGTNTIQMRIDADVDLFGSTAPTGTFNVIGIGGQFDASNPYTSGYQLLPRYSADIASAGASVDLGPDQVICSGDTVTLDGGNGFITYAWCNGPTSQTYTVTAGGNYCIEVTNSNGCTSRDTVLVVQETTPLASFTNVPTGLSVAFTNTSSGGSTYAWDFGDSQTSTQQNPTHNYTTAGTYTVTLIATNACGSDTTTQTVTVIDNAVTNGLPGSLAVFPNPSNGQFMVEISGITGEVKVEVLDLAGRSLWTRTAQGAARMDVNLEAPAGMYLLRASQGNAMSTRKIVVR